MAALIQSIQDTLLILILQKVMETKLIVALNSDAWLEKKKGKFFMPFDERKVIVESIKFVDEVIGFKDDTQGLLYQCIRRN